MATAQRVIEDADSRRSRVDYLGVHYMDSAEKARAETFAPLVGLSVRRVHQLVERGVLTRGASVGEWAKAYSRHLAETAEARSPEELRVAKARLARAQAERAEWGNAHMREELHPTAEIAELRAHAEARIWELIAALPDAVLRQAPHLKNDLGPLRLALEQIAAIVQSEPRNPTWNTTPKPKKRG